MPSDFHFVPMSRAERLGERHMRRAGELVPCVRAVLGDTFQALQFGGGIEVS